MINKFIKKALAFFINESICAINHGEKKFISFYGSQSYDYIGDDIRKPLLKIRNKIKRYQKILNKDVNKNGTEIKNKS